MCVLHTTTFTTKRQCINKQCQTKHSLRIHHFLSSCNKISRQHSLEKNKSCNLHSVFFYLCSLCYLSHDHTNSAWDGFRAGIYWDYKVFLHLPGLSLRQAQAVGPRCHGQLASNTLPDTSRNSSLLAELSWVPAQHTQTSTGPSIKALEGPCTYAGKGTGRIYNSLIPSVQFCIEWKRQVNFKIKKNTLSRCSW